MDFDKTGGFIFSKMNFTKVLVVLASLLYLTACEERPQELSFSERSTADSIYREELKILRVKVDSLCQQRQDSTTRAAIDSLYDVRLEEITRQLNRIKNVE